MQTIWTHLLPSSSTSIKCGVIAIQNKSIYVGNPLQHYSYDPFGQNRTMSSPRSLSTQMKVSNNERFLALASDIVDLMDLERAKVVRQFTEHTNAITGICNENSSPHIWATVGLDKTMRIFDSRQHPGQILCIRNDYRHRCITYAPNSQMLFCGGENIFIFDIRANAEFNSIKTCNQVLDLFCHPFDCVVAGCTDDRMIKVWDIDTKECLTQSFPLESQPQKVLFEENGNAIITCTAEKLYTCGWEPFHVISQLQWSKSKQSKFLIMNGEDGGAADNSISPRLSSSNASVTTLDIKINDGIVMHLGISETSKIDRCLGLRSVQVEHLLHPRSNDEDTVAIVPSGSLSERISSSSPAFQQQQQIDSNNFDASPTTFLPEDDDNSLESARIITTPSPIMLSPTKTPTDCQPLIRKLPRSTSTSRSNLLLKQQQQSPKKTASPSTITVAGSGPIRARSSSTNSLHGSVQRTNSGGPERKNREHLPPKAPPSQSRQQQQQQKQATPTTVPKSATRRPSGCKSYDEMKSSSSNFISMIKNRKNGIQRIKATMKSRHNNEDEVFDEAISLPDKTVFIHLLQQLSSKPISLKLAARILPEIRFLLSHKNSSFIDTALGILDASVTQLKDSIKQGLASNAQSIGVDIAAEQRQLLCIKCKESLTEIYVNVHFLTAKFNEEQNLYFNSIIDKFMDLVS